jgi:hypothetical protein
MGQLDEGKFAKMMAYLSDPASRRVRTNNHVERTNRMFRFLEKVRYKWRGRRTLVRFVVLTLDEIWQAWTPAETTKAELPNRAKGGESQTLDPQQSSRAACDRGGDQREVSIKGSGGSAPGLSRSRIRAIRSRP